MKLSYLVIFFLFFTLFSSLVFAVPSYTFKQNSDIDLKIHCFDINNSACLDSTVCLITIMYPNQTVLVRNQSMTYSNDYFNYTLSSSKTSHTGIYPVIVKCQGTTSAYSTFTYEVTPTGIKNVSFFDNSFLIVLGIIGFLLLGMAFYTGYEIFGFLGGVSFVLIGVYTMIYGFNNVANIYTRGTAFVVLGLGMIFIVLSSYEMLND